eukprot:gene4523-6737_t
MRFLNALRRQPLAQIVTVGNPVLRMKADVVDPRTIASGGIRDLVDKLASQVQQSKGFGLSAPQIGDSRQVFVMEVTKEMIELESNFRDVKKLDMQQLALTAIANPRIIKYGKQTTSHRESCLSIPGYSAHVRRSHAIQMEGLCAITGEQLFVSLTGWTARIVQHEVDHLNGLLYTDRMDPQTLATNENALKFFHQMDIDSDGAKLINLSE